MRGKTETEESVIRRVSINLIQSRRRQKSQGVAVKIKKSERAASSDDFGLSKAYQLLPHYRASDDMDKVVVPEPPTREGGPRFNLPELVHMNVPPPYEYLKDDRVMIKERKPGTARVPKTPNASTGSGVFGFVK